MVDSLSAPVPAEGPQTDPEPIATPRIFSPKTGAAMTGHSITATGPLSITASVHNPKMVEEARHKITELANMHGIEVYFGAKMVHLPTPQVSSPDLLGLPTEVLEMILKECLHNPDLGRSQTEFSPDGDQSHWYLNEHHYNLSPAILRVCKQLYVDGRRVLYDTQPFYMACTPDLKCLVCPLTRYHPQVACLWEIPAMKLVRRWNVFAALPLTTARDSGTQFRDFCRAICQSRLRSLNINLLPVYLTHRILMNSYIDIKDLLRHLKLFRNLPAGTMTIRDADVSEYPSCFNSAWFHEPNASSIPALSSFTDQDRRELARIVQSNDPVELIVSMYTALVKYCQTYERQPCLKQHMLGEYLCGRQGSPMGCGGSLCESHHINVYHPLDSSHSVEAAIRNAKNAILRDDDASSMDDFKFQRALALNYLEEQFTSIRDTSTSLIEFVKEEKRVYGIFSHQSSSYHPPLCNSSEHLKAVALIHDCAKAFERRMPLHVRINIMENQEWFDYIYSILPRETLLQQLDRSLRNRQGRISTALPVLRNLITDLDEQYIEMCTARRDLFTWDVDLEHRGVNINVVDAIPERICWDKVEPEPLPYPLTEQDFQDEEWKKQSPEGNDEDNDAELLRVLMTQFLSHRTSCRNFQYFSKQLLGEGKTCSDLDSSYRSMACMVWLHVRELGSIAFK